MMRTSITDGRVIESNQLAEDLLRRSDGLLVRTAEIHRARMMHRLGVRGISQAIRLSVLAGL